jgi:hypothetical protein
VNTYFERLSAAFAIAGLLVMAPLFAMAKLPTPANAHHRVPVAKKPLAIRAANQVDAAEKSGTA